jgi:hypothetical protein
MALHATLALLSEFFFADAEVFLVAGIILCLLFAMKNKSASYALLVLSGMTKGKPAPKYISVMWFISWFSFQLFGLCGIGWLIV